MATPNVGILTTAGKALIDKVNSGQAKISFSKIVFSSMDNSQLSDMQVKALTAIAPQEVVVSSPETTMDTNSGETRIRATGTNEKLADGVYVKTYGVFAKDDTGSEILYGVTVSPNPNYFPAYDGVTPQAVTYSYKTVIQETSNITMTNSKDVYASQEDLTEAIAAIPKPDLSNYATNGQLATKADDSKVVHKTGDEEISGSKTFDTAPIDKTTGNPYITKFDLNNGLSTKVNVTDTTNWQKQAMFTPGSYKIDDASSNLDFATLLRSKYNKPGVVYIRDNTAFVDAVVICEGNGWWHAYGAAGNGNFVHRRIRTTDDTGWVINADDAKVVHSTDMRKPASDVAGIEEVNAKQDKIGYTPADDSKVVHNSAIDPSIMAKRTLTADDDLLTLDPGTYWVLGTAPKNYPSGIQAWSTVVVRDSIDFRSETITDTFGCQLINIHAGNPLVWFGWRVPNSTTMASKSDVTTATATKADDSKVAHLSGANNFDTVPTVNNNPLLLASSLPSDLARTSQQTNFTAGLKSGGVDVATAADLKSIEDMAWRILDNKYITAFDKYNTSIKVDENSLFLVKIDEVNKRVYMFFTILGNFVENSSIYIDLTSIVKNLSFPSYYLYYLDGNTVSSTAHSSIVGNRICFKIENYDTTVLNSKYSSWMVNAGDADWTYSSCFVNYDELV